MPDETKNVQPDQWSVEMERMFSHVRSEMNLAYGGWRVGKPFEMTPVDYSEKADQFFERDELTCLFYPVEDLKGRSLVHTHSRVLAELIASIPDLCDVNLRPSSDSVVYCEMSGDRLGKIPAAGTSDPQRAFDTGFKRGFGDGFNEGCAEDGDDDMEIPEWMSQILHERQRMDPNWIDRLPESETAIGKVLRAIEKLTRNCDPETAEQVLLDHNLQIEAAFKEDSDNAENKEKA